MSKTVFRLTLPEPKVRKNQAPPAKAHQDKTKYKRKPKHQTTPDQAHQTAGFARHQTSKTG